MKRIFYVLSAGLLCLAGTLEAGAQNDVRDKAARFFDTKEWLNANALYLTALDAYPTDSHVFARAIVSSAMAGDVAGAVHLIGLAGEHSVDTSEMWRLVRADSFAAGSPTLYASLLDDARTAYPWMMRSIDRELLEYYAFRNNGEDLVAYAQKMLAGMPRNVEFLRLLARGHLLSGRTQEALDTWQRVLAINPDQYDTLLDMGNCLMLTGQAEKARPLLERADALRATPYVTAQIKN